MRIEKKKMACAMTYEREPRKNTGGAKHIVGFAKRERIG